MSEQGFEMVKPGGRHIVSFVPDEDTHFCNVCIRSRKTGQLTASHYILASEVPQWIARFEREGYKKEGQK